MSPSGTVSFCENVNVNTFTHVLGLSSSVLYK